MAGTLISWILMSAVALAAGTPAFVVQGEDLVTGAAIRLGEPSLERPVVAVFLSCRCPCSAAHEEALKELASAHPQARFVAVNANADETAEQSRTYFKKTAFPFPVLRDEGAVLANRWKALKTPHVFVFGDEGELLFQGGVDDSKQARTAKKRYLADALDAIKAGKKPDLREVRTLGCAIKR